MLKKAATQNTIKEQYEKLSDRLKQDVEDIEKLMAATNVPSYTAVPDASVLKNLL